MTPPLTYLFDHPNHKTSKNERAVELPLAFRYIEHVGGNLIEVGAVTPYYCTFPHICIDPTDSRATHHICAEDYDFTTKNVLSLSTIEHIGRGDYKLKKQSDLAYDVLKKIYKECQSCLITWPIGYNVILDSAIRSEKIGMFSYFFLIKTSEGKWETEYGMTGFDHKYGSPFRNGNSVIVVHKNVEWCDFK